MLCCVVLLHQGILVCIINNYFCTALHGTVLLCLCLHHHNYDGWTNRSILHQVGAPPRCDDPQKDRRGNLHVPPTDEDRPHRPTAVPLVGRCSSKGREGRLLQKSGVTADALDSFPLPTICSSIISSHTSIISSYTSIVCPYTLQVGLR